MVQEFLRINGGKKLSGTIEINGNKNEALPVLAAVLLTDEDVVIHNVPLIKDILTMIETLKDLGVSVEKIGNKSFKFNAANIKTSVLNYELATKIRGSLLFVGPLIARLNQAILPMPGGDKIGRRRIDTHILGFEALGISAKLIENKEILFEKQNVELKDEIFIFLDEASVTATENILLYAASVEKKIIIYNAACEPHVQNLANLLVKMGAKIDGIGTNKLTIYGNAKLKGTEHTILPDHIEIGSFITLAAVTNSNLTLKNCIPDYLYKINQVFAMFNLHYEINENEIIIPDNQDLYIKNDFGGAVPKIDDGPWPAFPADLTSVTVVLATQAKGTVLIFEKMFEARLFFVDKLIAMGANIVLCDPHRVVVHGPNQLYGTMLTSPDIRAGMSLVIAALAARGESLVYNIQQIDRGYENIDIRLQNIGANIERKNTVV